jgi:hypothetical protein
VIAHDGRLFMIGDGAAPRGGYESTNGVDWRAFDHDAGWDARYRASDASFNGYLWRVGGFVQRGDTRVLMNDVWRSRDGRRWSRVLDQAPWPARANAHLVAFRDSLWLLGGEPLDAQLWVTVDGVTWKARPAPPLGLGNPQGVLVLRDSLWLLGRGEWATATSTIWNSDGRHWRVVADSAPWGPRTGGGFGVLDGRMFVVAGVGKRDAWWSTDGRQWRELPTVIPGPPRGADYSAVFQNAFWIVGGKTGGAGGTGFWDGIVYLK